MKKLLCICLLVLLCLSGTAQGQPALNEPVYLMVHGQLIEQLQVLHSGPRTCTHPSFAFEKQEAPDELLCLPLSNFYHRIVTPCVAVCTLCGQHRVAAAASESRQPHDMQPSGDVHISAACHIYYEACACGETDSYVLACGEKNPTGQCTVNRNLRGSFGSLFFALAIQYPHLVFIHRIC